MVDAILIGMSVVKNDAENADSNHPIQIIVRNDNETRPTNTSIDSITSLNSIIITAGDIQVDRGTLKHRLYQWWSYSVFNYTFGGDLHECAHLFIDKDGSMYCAFEKKHQVIKIVFNTGLSTVTTTFGSGTNDSTSDSLNSPRGLFVDNELDVYVADTGNHRIQRFNNKSNNATTVAGNTTLGDMGLRFPTAVVVDVHGHLFIVDSGNHRIIRSERGGFRCIVGCSREAGFASNQLDHPRALWFDTNGNMFVLDQGNHRIQKFYLATNFSGMFDSFFSRI